MLYYDRIDIGEGIDPIKINKSKESMIPIIVFVIVNSNLKILYPMAVMI